MNSSISLLKSLTSDHIAVKMAASSWEEAVVGAGMVMVSTGLIQQSYIEAMKDAIKSLGPYCVIAPGIAMPHARPEDGVFQTGFSLITLETPVNFGSEANDPVDIVIGLAAINKQSHITVLKELATYLGDNNFIQNLRAARTKKDLLKVLDSKRKEI
ncbi:MAG: PTS sugar transporter subunit IIA [Deltaproteobacteria bacterium]|nr:PTS sugar transporter subunit IIA [Deltaproteobacteria bacterium]